MPKPPKLSRFINLSWCVSQTPHRPKLGLAYAYMSQGKTQQGLAIYKQLIQQNPKWRRDLDDAYDFVAKKHYAQQNDL